MKSTKYLFFAAILAFAFFSTGCITRYGARNGARSEDFDTSLQTLLPYEIVLMLAEGEFEQVWDAFNPELQAVVSTEALEEGWEQILALVGPFRYISGSGSFTDPGSGMEVYEVFMEHDEGSDLVLATIAFDGGSRIAGIHLNIVPNLAFLLGGVEGHRDLQTAEEILHMMTEGKFEQVWELFDDVMREIVSVDDLAMAWESTIDLVGPFQQVVDSFSAIDPNHNTIVHEILSEHEDSSLLILTSIIFDDQGQIYMLYLNAVPNMDLFQERQGDAALGEEIYYMMVHGYIEQVWELFDAGMRVFAPSYEALAGGWNQILETVGQFQRIVSSTFLYEPALGLEIYQILAEHEDSDLFVSGTIIFDSYGDIVQFALTIAPNPENITPIIPVSNEYFSEEFITVGADGNFPLPGILSMPVSDGPVPAVVLVHGSGPGNMHQTVGAISVFRDIAHYLAANGVAVVRYDKRTYAHPFLSMETYGTAFTVYEETIQDALLARYLLLNDDRIDPDRIYVIGLSLGGMLAPEIATLGDFAGFVIMAGTMRSLPHLMVEQIEYILGLSGNPPELTADVLQMVKDGYEAYRAARELPIEETRDILVSGIPAYYFINLSNRVTPSFITEWTRPALILHGTMDYQVRWYIDFVEYQRITEGMDNIRTILYPGLTHVFTQSHSDTDMGTPADYNFPEHVSEEVLRDIVEFILGE